MSTHFHGDYSNHDWARGQMDVAAMVRDGIEGGFHKLGDGLNFYMDPYFPEAARRMRGSGSAFWGAYNVLWGNRDIIAQANWHMSLLDAQAPGWRTDSRFRVMSDNEKFAYNVQPSPAQINQYHDYWASRVPGLRTQVSYAPDWVYRGAQAQIRYLNVASNYGSNPAVHYPVGYPGNASSRWNVAGNHVLQYGSLLIQGTQSTTDVNAVRDDAVWALLAGDDMTPEQDAILRELQAMLRMAHWMWGVNSKADYVAAGGSAAIWDAIGASTLVASLKGLSVPAPAPVDPAALKAVLLDPEVLTAIAKAVLDGEAARLQN